MTFTGFLNWFIFPRISEETRPFRLFFHLIIEKSVLLKKSLHPPLLLLLAMRTVTLLRLLALFLALEQAYAQGGPTGPTGPTGATGPTGPEGVPGILTGIFT